jgi:hypothetical protein
MKTRSSRVNNAHETRLKHVEYEGHTKGTRVEYEGNTRFKHLARNFYWSTFFGHIFNLNNLTFIKA